MLENETILTDTPGLLPSDNEPLPLSLKPRYFPEMETNRLTVDAIDSASTVALRGKNERIKAGPRSIIETMPQATPEQELWMASIYASVDDARGLSMYADKPCANNCNAQHTNQACAKAWFKSNARHVRSFLWVCDQVGLEPSYFRKMLGMYSCPSSSK